MSLFLDWEIIANLHTTLAWMWKYDVPSKRRYIFTSLKGYTFQKTGIFTKSLWELQIPQNAGTIWDVVVCRGVACVSDGWLGSTAVDRGVKGGTVWDDSRKERVLTKAAARTVIYCVGIDNNGHSRWVKAVATERCPSWPILNYFVTTVQIWLIPSPVPFPFLISVPSVFHATYSYGLNM